MYRSINDFLDDWKYESESTVKLFTNITDQKKNQKVTEDGRSLGYIAWHITQSLPEIMHRLGFKFATYNEQKPEPEKFSDVISFYNLYAGQISDQLKENWTDETLLNETDLYGETWKLGKVLSMLVIHQAHHRAQMTVLMRQAGLPVTGVYGPSREEWAAMGMEPQV
ncbi:MAG TPA: DinB family protein [Melioribacteraceae bacterium]|nr:DinB family protein [Melioribacteraceae bacterium]